MTAVRMPAVGGKPLAIEMPRHRGRAIKKTKNPEPRSAFQVPGNMSKLSVVPACGDSEEILIPLRGHRDYRFWGVGLNSGPNPVV
jgi:hypothetical protein